MVSPFMLLSHNGTCDVGIQHSHALKHVQDRNVLDYLRGWWLYGRLYDSQVVLGVANVHVDAVLFFKDTF